MSAKWWLVVRRSELDVSLWGCTSDNRWTAVATLEAGRDVAEAVAAELESELFVTLDDPELGFTGPAAYSAWVVVALEDASISGAERVRYRADINGKPPVDGDWREDWKYNDRKARQEAASRVIKRLTGANKRVIFSGKTPTHDVVDLCHKLAEGDDESANAIAREFTNGDAKKAGSLLSQIRRLKKNGRVRFE